MFHSEIPAKLGFPAVQRVFEAGLVGSCGASNKDAKSGENLAFSASGLASITSQRGTSMIEWRLKIGNKLTGIVVRPDTKWPSMWRIHGLGRVSDMVNLSRAKDAAISWALRDGFRPDMLDVKWDYGETARQAAAAA